MDLTATWYATAAAAWGCYLFGVACFRMANGDKLFLGVAKAALVTCPVVLSCFGIHATRQYQVILATTQIPLIEVANSDTGRERIIERIECPEGTIIEREHRAGWRVSFNNGSGLAASGAVLQRTEPGAAIDAPGPHCECPVAGCSDCLLGVPGCCGGKCEHCMCDPATRLHGIDL